MKDARGSISAKPEPLREFDVREPADSQNEADCASRVKSRQSKNRELNFVLLREDGQVTSSGSPADVERAERQRQNGEPLLWFRYDGREYVIRDRDLLRQARALWADVYESDFGPERLAAMAQAFNTEALAKHGRLAAEQGAFAQLGSMAVEQGLLGAKLGAMASEQALRALDGSARDSAPSGCRRRLEHQHQSLDESRHEIDEKMREMERRLKHDLDGQMEELSAGLANWKVRFARWRRRWRNSGAHGSARPHGGESDTRKAIEEMRALIERAIAAGLAQTVR